MNEEPTPAPDQSDEGHPFNEDCPNTVSAVACHLIVRHVYNQPSPAYRFSELCQCINSIVVLFPEKDWRELMDVDTGSFPKDQAAVVNGLKMALDAYRNIGLHAQKNTPKGDPSTFDIRKALEDFLGGGGLS